jgi:hypothetical protein
MLAQQTPAETGKNRRRLAIRLSEAFAGRSAPNRKRDQSATDLFLQVGFVSSKPKQKLPTIQRVREWLEWSGKIE